MTEPIAYIYQADIICEDCFGTVTEEIDAPDDPNDEHSYDSDDYPKAVFTGFEHSRQEHCGICHTEVETYIYHESGDDDCECSHCTSDEPSDAGETPFGPEEDN